MRHAHIGLWVMLCALGAARARVVFGASEIPALLPPLQRSDRLLILAPHEDDEALGTGGLIQRALAVKAALRIVYLTYGDHNEWAFMAYRKNPVLTPAINRKMGRLRRSESTEAMRFLGLTPAHLIFLGFPDNGTLEIWKEHWDDQPPLHSLLTNTTRVPYPDAAAYNRVYKGEEIVSAIKDQLLEFKPTRIFVTHPVDSNPDHRAYWLFLEAALLDLKGEIPEPEVYAYPIHMGAWPRPLGDHPDQPLEIPKILAGDVARCRRFDLTPEETKRKAETIRMYKSQMADHGYWLIALARRNELFVRPEIVDLDSAQWSPERRLVPHPRSQDSESEDSTGPVHRVQYRTDRAGLAVRIQFADPLHEDLGFKLFAFGYRRGRAFAEMPKWQLTWSWRGLRIRDQTQERKLDSVQCVKRAKEVELLLPWSVLGEPDHLFVQAQGLIGGIPISQTGWQILDRTAHGQE
jgi:LmbE family N-acetylglucosaminyl deacetylase